MGGGGTGTGSRYNNSCRSVFLSPCPSLPRGCVTLLSSIELIVFFLFLFHFLFLLSLIPVSSCFFPFLPGSSHFFPFFQFLPFSSCFFPFLPVSSRFIPFLTVFALLSSLFFFPFLLVSSCFFLFLLVLPHFSPFLAVSSLFFLLLPASPHFFPFLPVYSRYFFKDNFEHRFFVSPNIYFQKSVYSYMLFEIDLKKSSILNSKHYSHTFDMESPIFV